LVKFAKLESLGLEKNFVGPIFFMSLSMVSLSISQIYLFTLKNFGTHFLVFFFNVIFICPPPPQIFLYFWGVGNFFYLKKTSGREKKFGGGKRNLQQIHQNFVVYFLVI
jgi:hypothetical protein